MDVLKHLLELFEVNISVQAILQVVLVLVLCMLRISNACQKENTTETVKTTAVPV